MRLLSVFRSILRICVVMGIGWSANQPFILAYELGVASWYSEEACAYNKDPNCPTASGRSLYELEANNVLWAAAWQYPMHSKVVVCNMSNDRCVEVVILDRGPNKRLHRIIDLCKEAFAMIGDLDKGLIRVRVDISTTK